MMYVTHIFFNNAENELRNTVILTDERTHEDWIILGSTEYVNGAAEFAENVYLHLPGPAALALYNLESGQIECLATKGMGRACL